MKLYRLLTVAALLASFTVTQVPAPVQCQMSLGLPRVVCAMPCCKLRTTFPTPCPLVRPATHQDALIPSSQAVVSGVELATTWGAAFVSNPLVKVSNLRSPIETFTSLLLELRPMGRAPPLEYILVSA